MLQDGTLPVKSNEKQDRDDASNESESSLKLAALGTLTPSDESISNEVNMLSIDPLNIQLE